MKKKLIILFILIASCSSEIENSKQAEEEITYIKDGRTNLCFAQKTSYSADGYIITSITCVPCDSVRHLLK